jgi:hypothetical protein
VIVIAENDVERHTIERRTIVRLLESGFPKRIVDVLHAIVVKIIA